MLLPELHPKQLKAVCEEAPNRVLFLLEEKRMNNMSQWLVSLVAGTVYVAGI
ncbi:hypothetical protein DFP93_1078 [Aneurinibacillus soli]|uniref:Uncharacterized protein n=1 Tax=Aneurinibacillus soli TaxID=1500254 RepID=A0A0U4WIT6_9BACL|nr:hypothetical protein DFP93_1078 [Aneurinibacillus soli]BAU28523.1 hypothetical protein CB4_02697 [Aneurinibacillus soli]